MHQIGWLAVSGSSHTRKTYFIAANEDASFHFLGNWISIFKEVLIIDSRFRVQAENDVYFSN